MTSEQIEKHVSNEMKRIRENPCFDPKEPKSVSLEYLEGLKSEIETELEALGE